MKSLTKALCFFIALAVVAGCGQESPKLVPKADKRPDDYTQKPTDFTIFNPKVDILFVIDNSGSMAGVQNELSANAFQFASNIAKVAILDYHIGVLSTDMDYCNSGSSSRDACGRLIGFPTFLQKSTPDFVSVLSRRMVLGTNGSATEQMFSPVIAALSSPLDTGVNKDFYRQDAFLAVIFITDAKEQSKFSPQDLLQFLKQKKGDSNRVLAYGVIRKLAEEDTCGRDSGEDLDNKLEDFLSSVVNGKKNQENVLSLCTPDYGAKLADFSRDIVTRAAGRVKLNRMPSPKEKIRVMYGTQEIPNDPIKGWTYERETNSLYLAPGIDWKDQGPNVTLVIDFKLVDTP